MRGWLWDPGPRFARAMDDPMLQLLASRALDLGQEAGAVEALQMGLVQEVLGDLGLRQSVQERDPATQEAFAEDGAALLDAFTAVLLGEEAWRRLAVDDPEAAAGWPERIRGEVAEHGFSVTDTAGAAGAASHTTGLLRSYGHPEVVATGAKGGAWSLGEIVLAVARHVREGRLFKPDSIHDDLVEGLRVIFLPVQPENLGHLHAAMWYYDRYYFPALQVVWADGAGSFPWDGEQRRTPQEILCRPPEARSG